MMFDPITHGMCIGKSRVSCLLGLHHEMPHELEEREEIQIREELTNHQLFEF